jgi:hypothetical protein
MILFHVDHIPVEDVIEGRLYVIPPREPIEVEDKIGKLILAHKSYQGVVEVKINKTSTGWTFDIDEAKEEAVKLRKEKAYEFIDAYIYSQLNDYIRYNLPPRPPQGRVVELIKEFNIDLSDHEIRPPGWQSPVPYKHKAPADGGGAVTSLQQMMMQMQNQIAQQNEQIARQNSMISDLIMGRQPSRTNPPVPASIANEAKSNLDLARKKSPAKDDGPKEEPVSVPAREPGNDEQVPVSVPGDEGDGDEQYEESTVSSVPAGTLSGKSLNDLKDVSLPDPSGPRKPGSSGSGNSKSHKRR